MNKLVEAARKYIGTPYKHRGRTARGLDCAGLPWLAYADCGLVLPDLRLYGREPHMDGMMQAAVDALGRPVSIHAKATCKRADLQPGDVAVLAFVSEPHHMAIVGDDAMYGLSFIHADGSLGVSRVVEHGVEDQHVAMVVAVFRRPV